MGTKRQDVRGMSFSGLSPRVRGNHTGVGVDDLLAGSIPACAGKPLPHYRLTGFPKVYPRVCGETSTSLPLDRLSKGLSPRVRGNLVRVAVDVEIVRSIPACAGKPQL